MHPITALQTEYSLWSRDVEQDGVLALCRSLGIGFVAYSPLGRGFLTGAIPDRGALEESDWRRQNPRFTDDALARNAGFVALVRDLAERKRATPAQVALAWVLAQGTDVFPIPGTRRLDRLQENLGALQLSLSAAELEEIRTRLPETVGARY